MRSRRSIRCYKENEVPREKLLQLLDIARFAPTGGNTQGLSYIVVSGKNTLHRLTECVIDWMESTIQSGVDWIEPYARTVQVYRKTKQDIILRDAPHLIISTVPKDFGLGRDNTRHSLDYVELLAPSLGLGTCWAGFFVLSFFKIKRNELATHPTARQKNSPAKSPGWRSFGIVFEGLKNKKVAPQRIRL
ncbi:nitroreductase family protein [Sporomusa silvacetica]|uniref:nitroreductase family protein n=1 Tax=Sporomusa silvacetica TaxID=55504 RepID=UPI001B804BC3|nr:nitroreductase family protein [Sporomusa silvacetica]